MRHRVFQFQCLFHKVILVKIFSRSWINVAPPCRAFSTWLYSVSPFSQLRSVTAYKSRPFLSHFILCTFLQRLAVHVVDGVDDAVPVGGVAVFRFHMAPADLAGKSHRADSGSSGF